MRELVGNPAFKDGMKYAPEQHYEDEQLKNRVYGEMAAGDWWWEIQASARFKYPVMVTSKYLFTEFNATCRASFPLVQRCRQSIFHRTRQTYPGSLVISRGGQCTLLLGTSARIRVVNSQSVRLSSLDTFRLQSWNALTKKTALSKDIASSTSA